jgi:hypothetical protein
MIGKLPFLTIIALLLIADAWALYAITFAWIYARGTDYGLGVSAAFVLALLSWGLVLFSTFWRRDRSPMRLLLCASPALVCLSFAVVLRLHMALHHLG